jgi:hypothetical protein
LGSATKLLHKKALLALLLLPVVLVLMSAPWPLSYLRSEHVSETLMTTAISWIVLVALTVAAALAIDRRVASPSTGD